MVTNLVKNYSYNYFEKKNKITITITVSIFNCSYFFQLQLKFNWTTLQVKSARNESSWEKKSSTPISESKRITSGRSRSWTWQLTCADSSASIWSCFISLSMSFCSMRSKSKRQFCSGTISCWSSTSTQRTSSSSGISRICRRVNMSILAVRSRRRRQTTRTTRLGMNSRGLNIF